MQHHAHRKIITAGVIGGIYLAAMESTVVTTAMPTIIGLLGGLEIYGWVFSIYLLTSTVSIPVWGRLSDLYGRRRLFLSGLAVFLTGSLLCGVASTMPQLIGFRALQGVGAGALVPLALTIIGELYTFDERARMQAVFSGIWGFASITGPVLGGFITDHLSWRWVFFVNLPVGLVAGLCLMYLMDAGAKKVNERSGIRRGVLMALSIGLFLLYLMEASENGWFDWRYVGLIPLSTLLFWFYIRLERRSGQPFVPPQLFKNPMFIAASITTTCIGMVLYGILAFLPLFAQVVMGRSATGAGSVVTPALLTWVVFSAVMGRFLRRTGFYWPVMIGMSSMIAGTAIIARMGDHPPDVVVILGMVFVGAGMGLNTLPMLIGVQSAVSRDLLGIATSAIQFFRSIGGAVGVAVMGSQLSGAIAAAMQQHPDAGLIELLRHPENLSPTNTGATVVLFREVLAGGLHRAFTMAFLFALLAFASSFLVPRQKPVPGAVSEPGMHLE